jgi:hypothetical protein
MLRDGGIGDMNTKPYLVSHFVKFFYTVTAFSYELLSVASPHPFPSPFWKKERNVK